MAHSAVGFLLENLEEILSDFVSLLASTRSDLGELRNQVSILKDVLGNALKKIKDEKMLKTLDGQVKELVYEVDDMVDTLITRETMPKKSGSSFRRLFGNHQSTGLDQVIPFMEGKLKPLIHNIMEVLEKELSISDESDTDRNQGQTREDPWKKAPREDTVVGLEDDLEILVSRLLEESDSLEVIPITGSFGIGKTAMAKRIFHFPRIIYEFPTCIWVNVTKEFNIKHVCLTIMKAFTSSDLSSMNVEELISMVREYLLIAKFLVVMDDVWTKEAWDQIKQLFPKSNKMGRVLITTRMTDVAFDRDPLELRFLNEEESWELLQLQVFGRISNYPLELEEVGKHIAALCNGLPLSIIVIGGILIDRVGGQLSTTKREWERISHKLNAYLYDHHNTRDTMNNIISWSYASLPPESKDCFLYLGVFPEDTEISVWRLTRLWIAEGFIRKVTQRSLEETATEVLKDLINRNLLMVSRINIQGEFKTCRVHDLIREFCIREARDIEKHGLFQEIRKSEHGIFEPPIPELHSFRRLCIHSHVLELFSQKPNLEKARSFLCFSMESYTLDTIDMLAFANAFSLVRVLDANAIKFIRFPARLMRMIHLRYITLSLDYQLILPEVISTLWNLQTLVLNTSSRTLEIKADIWKMRHLRHLKTNASIFLKEGNGEGDGDLQTLTKLSPESSTPSVFRKAKNLKKLGIRGNLSKTSMSFSELHSLEKLTLEHEVHTGVQAENPMNRLPEPNDFPPTIRFLVLSGTYLNWKHMSTLGQIVTLEVLKLKYNAFIGSTWDVAEGSFENLKALSIERIDLKYWVVASSNTFGKLRTLELKSCEQLVQIPIDLEKTLEKLYMERVTKYAVSYAKKIEQKRAAFGKGGFNLVIAAGDL